MTHTYTPPYIHQSTHAQRARHVRAAGVADAHALRPVPVTAAPAAQAAGAAAGRRHLPGRVWGEAAEGAGPLPDVRPSCPWRVCVPKNICYNISLHRHPPPHTITIHPHPHRYGRNVSAQYWADTLRKEMARAVWMAQALGAPHDPLETAGDLARVLSTGRAVVTQVRMGRGGTGWSLFRLCCCMKKSHAMTEASADPTDRPTSLFVVIVFDCSCTAWARTTSSRGRRPAPRPPSSGGARRSTSCSRPLGSRCVIDQQMTALYYRADRSCIHPTNPTK